MKTASKVTLGSQNNSTQSSLTSKLSRMGVTLSMAATLCGLAVSGLSTYSIAQEQSASQATIDHPDWVHVPGELIRPDCVHEIPNGAKVEIENGQITGDVTLNGAFIAHYDVCPEDALMTRPRHGYSGNAGGLPCSSCAGGWVEASQWNPSLSSNDNIDLLYGDLSMEWHRGFKRGLGTATCPPVWREPSFNGRQLLGHRQLAPR
jgi:hypothetical protein